jgi:hypothetical protein
MREQAQRAQHAAMQKAMGREITEAPIADPQHTLEEGSQTNPFYPKIKTVKVSAKSGQKQTSITQFLSPK